MNFNRHKHFCIAFSTVIAALYALLAVRIAVLHKAKFAYYDREFSLWQEQKDFLATRNNSFQTLLLGDSRVLQGLIPEHISPSCRNLAVGGGTPVEMYFSLKDYLKSNSVPKTVIMAFAVQHYCLHECYKSRTQYFHYFSAPRLFLFELAELFSGRTDFTTVKEEMNNATLYYIFAPSKYSAAGIKSRFKRTTENLDFYTQKRNQKGFFKIGNKEFAKGLNWEAKQKSFTLSKRQDFYLKKIISLCTQNEINLYIEQPPMNPESLAKITQNGFYDAYKEYLCSLQEKYGIPVEKTIPEYPNEFFTDTSHLNQPGAERYSRYVKEKYRL